MTYDVRNPGPGLGQAQKWYFIYIYVVIFIGDRRYRLYQVNKPSIDTCPKTDPGFSTSDVMIFLVFSEFS
jgi:hypothetical protein